MGEQGTDPAVGTRGDGECRVHPQEAREKLGAGEFRLPEKKWALKPFLETVLSDLNSTRMLLYWEVMTSGFSEPQNLPCSLESAVSPLRTSTKSYLHTCRVMQLQAHLRQEASPVHPCPGGFLFWGSFHMQLPALPNLATQNGATLLPSDRSSCVAHKRPSPASLHRLLGAMFFIPTCHGLPGLQSPPP